MPPIVPVILSGGSGTRLWPMSRTLYPKQLQALYSDSSMLVETARRVSGDGFTDPIIICNGEHRFIVAEQLLEAGIQPQAIVLEPVGRNTAPAAAVAALMLTNKDPDAMMLLKPADHMITKPNVFVEACLQARKAADDGALVTFGIIPHKPETGFGYIHKGPALAGFNSCHRVEKFVEKPDVKTAEGYVADGGYLWNSGMFLFRAQDYLDELSKQCPEMVEACRRAVHLARQDMDFLRLDEQAFQDMKGNSIDYAVMEKAQNVLVVPVDMGWDDVGSWSSLWAVGDKDTMGNILLGDVIAHDVAGSYMRSSGQLIAAIGMKDIVVVATDDVILVAPMDRAQEVKEIVKSLDDLGRTEQTLHKRVYRPWGWYQSMHADTHYQVKQLTIHAGGVLSLQSHQHRSEHWVVVSGEAEVTCGDELITLAVNQSTYIPAGMKHRLENKTKEPLCIIEVQTGSYLGEDDIERFEDVYGRT
ncbi:mannose-1-phosphate guanylyltransferase/mannose-6-phosphate isomerase [Magnetovibrio blakemorei]|nr:mannose-1-phosphate guanylyltransferase/mannose-6-phosphate isomerase [Magnetovibrio blakemorei]